MEKVNLLWEESPTRAEVKEMIEKTGIPKRRIALRIGIKPQALDYQLQGKARIKPEMFQKIKRAIKEIREEGSGSEREGQDVNVPGERYEHVGGNLYPILKKFQLIEGVLDMSTMNISGYTFFPYPVVENCFCIVNHGDQMVSEKGVSINDGDYLLVDLSQKIVKGDMVFLYLNNGREMVRQLVEDDGKEVALRCLNTRYPDIALNKDEIVRMGRVCMKHAKVEVL